MSMRVFRLFGDTFLMRLGATYKSFYCFRSNSLPHAQNCVPSLRPSFFSFFFGFSLLFSSPLLFFFLSLFCFPFSFLSFFLFSFCVNFVVVCVLCLLFFPSVTFFLFFFASPRGSPSSPLSRFPVRVCVCVFSFLFFCFFVCARKAPVAQCAQNRLLYFSLSLSTFPPSQVVACLSSPSFALLLFVCFFFCFAFRDITMLDFLVHSLFLFFVCVFLDVFFFFGCVVGFFFFFAPTRRGARVCLLFAISFLIVFWFFCLCYSFSFFFFFSIFVCAVCFFVCLCLFFFVLFSEHPPIYVETPYGAS